MTLKAFFLTVRIFVPTSQVFWPPKDATYMGQNLFCKLFQKEGLFNFWEYKSFRPKVRVFLLKWWPILCQCSLYSLVSCWQLFFLKLLLPVVRPAGVIEFFGLLCQPVWVRVMLGAVLHMHLDNVEFSSSCLGFKHSSLLPVQTKYCTSLIYSNQFFLRCSATGLWGSTNLMLGNGNVLSDLQWSEMLSELT